MIQANTQGEGNTSYYMAIDQYGQTYHGLRHPRRDLLKLFARQHAGKMYIDKIISGESVHIGYVIARHWLTVYSVKRIDKG